MAAQEREETAIRGFEQAVEARRADVEMVEAELKVVQQRVAELQELRSLVSPAVGLSAVVQWNATHGKGRRGGMRHRHSCTAVAMPAACSRA